MIKAGQIYELPITGYRFVVYAIVGEMNPDKGDLFDWIYILFENEYKDRLWRKTVEEMKLVAEYPTWQEAIRSPEFRGENKKLLCKYGLHVPGYRCCQYCGKLLPKWYREPLIKLLELLRMR